ncbi:hypothetical protein MRQ36_25825 [Micromonospora sp. R77]|uniref:hypothetical protein n=1 Tax=Micromonospora sp. R77 TaxID=2925836 RepID=UPI001F6163C5|nr:hypothetical protein [Micromonospora sp. R77]MCI4065792.1 hypothetical protein [Micromonospora sp. R77]
MTRSVSTVDEIRRSRTAHGSVPVLSRTAVVVVPRPGRIPTPAADSAAASVSPAVHR